MNRESVMFIAMAVWMTCQALNAEGEWLKGLSVAAACLSAAMVVIATVYGGK